MPTEFSILFNYLKNMRNRYFKAICSWHVYRSLENLGAPNIVGEQKACENVQTMNKFIGFFFPAKEALRTTCLLELAKLFDVSQNSLHIDKMVNFAQSNVKRLTKQDFLQFHKDRRFVEQLLEHYEEMSNKDLVNVKSKIDGNRAILEKLKTYRDQYLAHDDVNKDEAIITRGEVETLIELIKDILGLFSLKLDFSTTVYDFVESDGKNHTKNVVGYLQKFQHMPLPSIK